MVKNSTLIKIHGVIDAIFYSEGFGLTHTNCIKEAEKFYRKLNLLGIECYQNYMEYKLMLRTEKLPAVMCGGNVCHALTGEVLIMKGAWS